MAVEVFDWQPIFLSFKIATTALVLVFISATLLALWVTRGRFAGKNILETIVTLPLVLPPVVTGFFLLWLIGRYGFIGRFLNYAFATTIIFTPIAAVLAAVIVAFPLMYQSAKAAFLGVNPSLQDAARTLGASEKRVFFTVTLPLAAPGLLGGVILTFARALGEFGATVMVAGNIPGKTQTLPLAIYFAAEENNMSSAGIYVLIITLLNFALIFGANRWLQGRTARSQQQGYHRC